MLTARQDHFECPTCGRFFTSTTPYHDLYVANEDGSSDTEFSDDYDSVAGSSRRRRNHVGSGSKKNNRSKGRDALGFEPKTSTSEWINKYDHDPDFPLTPSAKTTALKAILLKGFQEAPMDKVSSFPVYSELVLPISKQYTPATI
jgi:hypothetical protein